MKGKRTEGQDKHAKTGVHGQQIEWDIYYVTLVFERATNDNDDEWEIEKLVDRRKKRNL